ncbi:DUF2785 domain-containing protein [Kitasatospora sp. NBC_01287]|uniref:DUF2785 domain-containing protein n=1 Tax=Kitasatospora sp. NBC_01287 TaxID=2903573 RepID=UPI0022502E4F|nr:DUF2785 domain-containing protein [Kitasatospora sp. NBC_01287]MCX4744236.1 DUF2785 domain-containing protein [Kitasatospora sp. NBC_01287]
MTTWQTLLADPIDPIDPIGPADPSDPAAPAFRPTPELVAEVSAALRSPDPVVRDDQAFVLLARWIPDLPTAIRHSLGTEMAARFTDPEIQSRTFAPLVLAALVRHGAYDPAWLAAFARWYPAETDLRGYDPELGWLHAAAHGADLLGALGRCPQADPVPLLELAVARLLAPTEHLFDAMEDDRLGLAIALTLTRAELTERQAVDWLRPITAEFRSGQPGPMPAHASNTMRTLRVVHLLASRGVRPHPYTGDAVELPHAAAVREAVAAVLAIAAPYAG